MTGDGFVEKAVAAMGSCGFSGVADGSRPLLLTGASGAFLDDAALFCCASGIAAGARACLFDEEGDGERLLRVAGMCTEMSGSRFRLPFLPVGDGFANGEMAQRLGPGPFGMPAAGMWREGRLLYASGYLGARPSVAESLALPVAQAARAGAVFFSALCHKEGVAGVSVLADLAWEAHGSGGMFFGAFADGSRVEALFDLLQEALIGRVSCDGVVALEDRAYGSLFHCKVPARGAQSLAGSLALSRERQGQ